MVVAVRELDHQGRTEVGEELDDLVERHGVGEREVVDDGEAQHQIGAHSIDERRPFPRPPAERRATDRTGRARAAGCAARPSLRSWR